jgi:hypothetical protein
VFCNYLLLPVFFCFYLLPIFYMYLYISCFFPILIFPQGSSIDRNRASPAPVIKLYESLTPEKRNAIVEMGQGSLLTVH